jgi:hypothetical protein
MTEDEAKTKWCPHVRALALASNNFPIAANRVTDTSGTPEQSRCIGSACMAWRWIAPTPMFRPGTMELAAMDPGTDKPTRGYCGLAGKP